ncbi:unnamed protein product [marine sediment metagenome]|uniref:Uncharacterized protein n=1 Tax=marine sediment metagenome TaxID=412755 RepID=X1BDP5_9ZZZZ
MPDFFKCEIRVSVADIVSKMHLYYEQTGGAPGPLSAVGAEEAFRVHVKTKLLLVLSIDARWESTKFTKVDGPTIPAWRTNNQDFKGTGAANAMPANNCVIANLRNVDGLLDRPGRLFISGVSSAELQDGFVESNFITTELDDLYALLLTIPIAGTPAWGGELRVRRTIIAGIKQDPPVYVPVTSIDTTSELGTQHVRKGELTGYVV